MKKIPAVSVVVPVFNEVETVPVLVGAVRGALEAHGDWELILVDDGSTDGTARAAEVEGHSIHHCRHTFASELLRASGNLRLVQKQLGHSKITTTQVYADVFDSEMDEAIERIYCR